MSDDLKKAASIPGSSNELIAHTMAARMLAQVSRGKNKKQLMDDLNKTRNAYVTAHKAFYHKDPESIALLQLDENSSSLNDPDQIFLETEEGNGPSDISSLQVSSEQFASSRDTESDIKAAQESS
jgi:hypothetical protein